VAYKKKLLIDIA